MLDLAAGRDAIHRDITASRAQLDELTMEDWRSPTALTGWIVSDLARHFAWGQELQAEAWRRARTRVREPKPPSAMSGAGRREILDALDQAHHSFMGELLSVSAEDLHRPCPLPTGPLPGWLVMQLAVMEAGIHRYDLERSLGLAPTLAADVIAATIEGVTATLPGLAYASQEQPESGSSICLKGDGLELTLQREAIFWSISTTTQPSCTVRGKDASVLLFALGRVGPNSPELAIEGRADLALRFKTYFPGP
jgi:uncharacterized protein (TIGR03083 family)